MLKQLLHIFILLILVSQDLTSQILIGTVTDSEYRPINGAQAYDSLSKQTFDCDRFGNFSIPLTNKTIITIKHLEFQSKNFTILGDNSVDTIYRNFVLSQKIQLVQEVDVTSKRMKEVVDQRNINVVDYLPYKEFILTIKTAKSHRLLSLEGPDSTLLEFDLGTIKARTFFEDCFGNVHVLSEDSSYQVWIDTSLQIISRSSIKQFNDFIKPCIANFNDHSVFNNFTNRHKKYTITSINKESKKKETIFQLHDKTGEKVASSHYRSIIGYYFGCVPEYANMITLKVWNGDLMSLNCHSIDFLVMIVWQLKILEADINVHTFQNNDDLVILDQFSDSIHIYNKDNVCIQSKHYSFNKGSTVFDPICDVSNNTYYDISLKDGIYTLTSINPVFNSKAKKKQISITEVPFAKNIKVFDDYVYFLVEENNFFGLYKINIPILK